MQATVTHGVEITRITDEHYIAKSVYLYPEDTERSKADQRAIRENWPFLGNIMIEARRFKHDFILEIRHQSRFPVAIAHYVADCDDCGGQHEWVQELMAWDVDFFVDWIRGVEGIRSFYLEWL